MNQRLGATLVVLAACGGAEKGGTSMPEPAKVDATAIAAAVTADVKAQYAAMSALDTDAWATHFGPDITLLGSNPTEVWSGKPAVAAGIHSELDPIRQAGGKGTVDSKDLRVAVAPDGSAAWVSDQLDFAIAMPAGAQTLHMRMTELYARAGAAWQVDAAVFSVGLPNDQAFAMAQAGKLPPLTDVGNGVAAGADAVVTAVDAILAHPGDEVLSSRDDLFVFGSAPEEAFAGAKAHEMFGRQVKQYGITIARNGGVRAGLVAGGTVAWAICNVDFTVHDGGQAITQPYRAMLVLLKEPAGWRLVQAHFSNGVPDQ